MPKGLVIVESPAKAKTIGKILGRDYVVKSSVGHIRDLPVKSIGVDVDNGFEPKYVMVHGKKKVVDELRKAAQQCDTVYLAPDPDREGEAIAWHLKVLLEEGNEPKKAKKAKKGTDAEEGADAEGTEEGTSAEESTDAKDAEEKKDGEGKKFVRIQYNEITKRAVLAAFDNPGELNMDRVDAQQARRILDRIVGYTVSPMLWRRVKRGLSAGRVQSVALRLVCEREREILGFTPESYWIMGALVRKLVVPLEPFNVKLTRIDGDKAEIKSEEDAARVVRELEGRSLKVEKVSTKEVTKRPVAPFITSTMQQAASSYLSLAPSRTMGLAQRLYEGVELKQGPVGLITYMRTDSVSIAKEAQDECRKYITNAYGDAFCPETPNTYKSRSSAQEAHEAIRPTDVNITPKSLSGKLDGMELKLYELIWRRFVASQMTPARIEQRTAIINVRSSEEGIRDYQFSATASEVVFDGYMKASSAGVKRQQEKASDDSDEVIALPALNEGEPLTCIEWLSDRKETKPPSRYSEASLIKALESNGVGRPSTYATICGTLNQRAYVSKEKRTLVPTELGLQVTDLLVNDLDQLFNVDFTASMEQKLDDVENGNCNWRKMLEDFYGPFKEWMENAKEPPADPEDVVKVLKVLEGVEEWAPPVRRGRRLYSDEKFVESLQEQAEAGGRPVTKRQLETLLRISCRYRSQLSDKVDAVLAELNRSDLLEAEDLQPPRPTTIRKLELLKNIELTEETRKFADSLGSQVFGGRCLSVAQRKALDSMVSANSDKIEDFETIKPELQLEVEIVDDGGESEELLKALSGVENWREPSRRGRRVYDDQAFCKSLCDHHARKGFLSDRQRSALKRLVGRYNEQIPDFSELSQKYDVDKPKEKQEKAAKE